jgi:CubicO group peptidase (beta-lactamase class C family)
MQELYVDRLLSYHGLSLAKVRRLQREEQQQRRGACDVGPGTETLMQLKMLRSLVVIVSVALLLISDAIATPPAANMTAAADYSKSHGGQTMLVLFDGDVAFERYDNGGASDRMQMLASGSKSFVGVAAVAAVQDGLIKLDDRVSEAIPQWKADAQKSQITYRQLLTLTSGLSPSEHPVKAPAWHEIIQKPMLADPGERFLYGGNQHNALAYALQQKLGGEKFEDYLNRRILDLIGVKLQWRFRCADGHPQVAGGAFMTARDWAKFGELVRRGGKWNGQQVVEEKLLAMCFEGTAQNPAYGLTWWLKKPVSSDLRRLIPTLSREWGDVANSQMLPDDLIAACGAGKQRLYIIPSLRLVIVRQGFLSQSFSDLDFLSLLLHPPSVGR